MVRCADTAGGAGFNSHVAKGHARFHVHGRHHGAGKFDHLVGGTVDTDTADNRQDDILGKNSLGEAAGNV
jgi:hypothetical protein